jgi:hypothetical protein
MGTVAEAYRWDVIAPNETVGVFIHSYGKNEFVSFSITVDLHANEPAGAYTQIAAQLSEGLTNEFFGQVARTLWVQNQTIGPQPYISVGLKRFRQSI